MSPAEPSGAARPVSQARASTGIVGLDEILGGGLPTNHLYLIDGEPGTGKTTLALQFLLAGAHRGERGLYVTLSESRAELVQVAESHGWTLDTVDVFELSAEESGAADEGYTIFHPAEIELQQTMNAVIASVERSGATLVVLDSLSEMRLLARDPLRFRRQILAIKQFFAGRQCTVLLLDDKTAPEGDLQLHSLAHGVIALEHVALEYGSERLLPIQVHELLSYLAAKGVTTIMTLVQRGIFGSPVDEAADISYLADTVVLLRYFEMSGAVRQAVSVVKKRSGNHERTIRECRVATGGLHVGSPLSEFQGVLTGVPSFHGAPAELMPVRPRLDETDRDGSIA